MKHNDMIAVLRGVALFGMAALPPAWASQEVADERPMAKKQGQQQNQMQMRLEKMRSHMEGLMEQMSKHRAMREAPAEG